MEEKTEYQDNFPLTKMGAIRYMPEKETTPDLVFHMMVNAENSLEYPGPAFVWYTSDITCDLSFPALHLHKPLFDKIVNNLGVYARSDDMVVADRILLNNVISKGCTWESLSQFSPISPYVRKTLIDAVTDMFINMNGLYYYTPGEGNDIIESITADIAHVSITDADTVRDPLRDVFMEFFSHVIDNDGNTVNTPLFTDLATRLATSKKTLQ